METAFFKFLSLMRVCLCVSRAPLDFLRIEGGLLTAKRPEGILLFGFVLMGRRRRACLISLIVALVP